MNDHNVTKTTAANRVNVQRRVTHILRYSTFGRYITKMIAGELKKRMIFGYKEDAILYNELNEWEKGWPYDKSPDGYRSMKCCYCGRSWEALCYKESKTLECPICGKMVAVVKYG